MFLATPLVYTHVSVGINFRGWKISLLQVNHENNENWHPMKITSQTVVHYIQYNKYLMASIYTLKVKSINCRYNKKATPRRSQWQRYNNVPTVMTCACVCTVCRVISEVLSFVESRRKSSELVFVVLNFVTAAQSRGVALCKQ